MAQVVEFKEETRVSGITKAHKEEGKMMLALMDSKKADELSVQGWDINPALTAVFVTVENKKNGGKRASYLHIDNFTKDGVPMLIKALDTMSEDAVVEPLSEMLGIKDDDGMPIIVVTNKDRFLGASVILTEKAHQMIKKIGGKLFEDGFYVIPSSVHEVLAIPKFGGDDRKEYVKMIREINRTEVRPAEVLSDKLFEMTKDGKLRVVEK